MDQSTLKKETATEIENYYDSLEVHRQKLRNKLLSPFLIKLFFIFKLPMGLISGLRIRHIDENECRVTVPYKQINTNPFKSTYFAVLSMAAEMSTGAMALVAIHKTNPSISMLVTKMESVFTKKATGRVTFTCDEGKNIRTTVLKALETGEPLDLVQESIGRNDKGEEVARFYVTWSFKARIKKS